MGEKVRVSELKAGDILLLERITKRYLKLLPGLPDQK